MKKVFTVINIILLITLVILSLYVFEIIDIPFLERNKGPSDPQIIVTGQEDNNDTIKVARKKSYDELMEKGEAFEKQGFYTQAIDAFTKAYNENTRNLSPLLDIARIHITMGQYEKAQELALEVLKKSPNNVQANLILGRSYLGLREVAQAKNIFDSINPENQESLYYRGIATLYFGNHEEGQQLLLESQEVVTNQEISDNAQIFLDALYEFSRFQAGQADHLKVLLARAFVKTDQPNMAIPLMLEVIKGRTDYRDAWIILGYSYLKIENYIDAIDALERAQKLDPSKPETLFFLGLAYAGNDQKDEAINTLELAIENGYEPKIYAQQKLAELYFQKNEFDKANENYEDVLTMNASDIDYFVRPVWLYIDKLNEPKKAVKLAEKAVFIHPDDAMSYNLLGWAQVANNDYINAKKNLEKSIALKTNFGAPYLNLGWMYQKQNNLDKAKELYKQAYEIERNSAVGGLAAERYNEIVAMQINKSAFANILE